MRVSPCSGLVVLLALGCGSGVGSVGAVLALDRETSAVHVRDAPEGFAADKAGLLAGDEVVMIDGVHVRDLDRAALRRALRGEVGSKVELTVVRGREVLRLTIVRGALPEPREVAPRQAEGED